MNNIKHFFGAAAFFVMLLTFLPGQAQAQRQGGGNNAAGTTLVFDYVASVNGKTPSWSGDFTMAAPVYYYSYSLSNLSFSIRGKNLNVPDNTRLFITLYTSDIATGTQTDTDASRWHCMSSMQVVGKLGIVKGFNDFMDPLGYTVFRHLDSVVITDATGTVLATAHPQ